MMFGPWRTEIETGTMGTFKKILRDTKAKEFTGGLDMKTEGRGFRHGIWREAGAIPRDGGPGGRPRLESSNRAGFQGSPGIAQETTAWKHRA